MTRPEASRINGAASHGPITAEGKARSSMNALKHGLTAQDMCIAIENPEEFNAFQQRYFDKLQPQDQIELDLVKEMVSAKWRQERVWSLEAATIDFRMDCTKPDIDQHWGLTPRARAAVAIMEEATGSKSLQTYARYDAMLSRMYNRALRTLIQLRANPIPAPAEIELEPIAEPAPPKLEIVTTSELQNEPTPLITQNAELRNEPANASSPSNPRPHHGSADDLPQDLAA